MIRTGELFIKRRIQRPYPFVSILKHFCLSFGRLLASMVTIVLTQMLQIFPEEHHVEADPEDYEGKAERGSDRNITNSQQKSSSHSREKGLRGHELPELFVFCLTSTDTLLKPLFHFLSVLNNLRFNLCWSLLATGLLEGLVLWPSLITPKALPLDPMSQSRSSNLTQPHYSPSTSEGSGRKRPRICPGY